MDRAAFEAFVAATVKALAEAGASDEAVQNVTDQGALVASSLGGETAETGTPE